jgi:hypothetical protein
VRLGRDGRACSVEVWSGRSPRLGVAAMARSFVSCRGELIRGYVRRGSRGQSCSGTFRTGGSSAVWSGSAVEASCSGEWLVWRVVLRQSRPGVARNDTARSGLVSCGAFRSGKAVVERHGIASRRELRHGVARQSWHRGFWRGGVLRGSVSHGLVRSGLVWQSRRVKARSRCGVALFDWGRRGT